MYRWMREKICWCCFSAFILQFRAPRKKNMLSFGRGRAARVKSSRMEGKNNRIIIIAPSSSAFFCCLPSSVVVVIGGASYSPEEDVDLLIKHQNLLFSSFPETLVSSAAAEAGLCEPQRSLLRPRQKVFNSPLHYTVCLAWSATAHEKKSELLQGRTAEREDFLIFHRDQYNWWAYYTYPKNVEEPNERGEKRLIERLQNLCVCWWENIFSSFTSLFPAPKLIALGMYIFTNHSSSLQRTAIPLIWISRTFQLKDLNFHSLAVLTNWCYEIFCQH